jgi:CTP:phosphocholine cytidylyltransferase-like protein/thiamine kinase-like enzyme
MKMGGDMYVNVYKYDIMNHLIKEGYINQRTIAETTNYSLGKVNEIIRELMEEQYVNDQFLLTEKAYKEIDLKKPKNAIILAAGFGMRMVPINTEVPKGLLEIHGEPLIERLINQLHEVGIFDIDIVVGFLKEKYEYLIDKYGVNLVYNPDYAIKNNIYSLKLVLDKISNTYILPCDIWAEFNPFSTQELYSWYSISEMVDDDSNVRLNRQKELIPIAEGKGGNSMIGISYLLEEQANIVRDNIRILCKDKEHYHSFWEEALFYKGQKMTIYARVYSVDKVVEINTYEQLREMDNDSNSLDTNIISLIAKEMGAETKDIRDIIVLKKGMTNRSFRFHVNNKPYIMRIPGEGTDKLINRKKEYEVYQAIKTSGISDDIVYISAESGYKITKFLDNARVCNPFNEEDVRLCMQKLRSFHNKKLKVQHTFDIYERIDFYEELWNGKLSIFRDYFETKEKIMELKQIIESLPKEWLLTHVDAVPDNFLFIDNEIRLIDWEYAGMQDPHLDIAMFAIYAMYDREHVDRLIDSYFLGECSEEVRMKIYCYIASCGLLWSNWCEYKRFCGVEFGEYSLRQYRYAKEYYRIVRKEFMN